MQKTTLFQNFGVDYFREKMQYYLNVPFSERRVAVEQLLTSKVIYDLTGKLYVGADENKLSSSVVICHVQHITEQMDQKIQIMAHNDVPSKTHQVHF